MADLQRKIAILELKQMGCVPFRWIGIGLGVLGGYVIVAQAILWMKTDVWIEMPLLYFFIDAWSEIQEKAPLREIYKEVGWLSNPFVVLGVDELVFPPHGQYWELYTYFGVFSGWLSHPQSWLGLHKIVYWFFDKMPISVVCIILAMMFTGGASACEDSLQEQIDRLSVKKQNQDR